MRYSSRCIPSIRPTPPSLFLSFDRKWWLSFFFYSCIFSPLLFIFSSFLPSSTLYFVSSLQSIFHSLSSFFSSQLQRPSILPPLLLSSSLLHHPLHPFFFLPCRSLHNLHYDYNRPFLSSPSSSSLFLLLTPEVASTFLTPPLPSPPLVLSPSLDTCFFSFPYATISETFSIAVLSTLRSFRKFHSVVIACLFSFSTVVVVSPLRLALPAPSTSYFVSHSMSTSLLEGGGMDRERERESLDHSFSPLLLSPLSFPFPL